MQTIRKTHRPQTDKSRESGRRLTAGRKERSSIVNPFKWNPWLQLAGLFLLHLIALLAYKWSTKNANLCVGFAGGALLLGSGFCLISARSASDHATRLKSFVPAVCYALFIFSLSHQSLKDVEMVIPGDFFHPLEYAALAVFLSWGWMHVFIGNPGKGAAEQKNAENGQGTLPAKACMFRIEARRSIFWATLITGTLYGVLDEWHQSWIPGRFPSLWDVLWDVFGLLLGLVLVRWLAFRSPGWASFVSGISQARRPRRGDDRGFQF